MHEVEEREARRLVLLRDRDDEPEVRLDELTPGGVALADELLELALLGPGEGALGGRQGLTSGLAGLDGLGETDLVVLGEKVVTTDVVEIETNQVLGFGGLGTELHCHGVLRELAGRETPGGRRRDSTTCNA